MAGEAPLTLEYDITGMDCGSCAAKVQRAVSRLPGVVNAEVALMAERLRLDLAPGGASAGDIEDTIRAIGFGVTRRRNPAGPAGATCGCDHGHAPSAPVAPAAGGLAAPRGADTRSLQVAPRWRLLIGTAALLSVAWLALPPDLARWAFVLACLLGTLPVARRAVSLLRAGVPFTIEGLMTIAAFGALAIGAAEEAAVVVFLFAVGEALERMAADRARRGIRALSALLPETAALVHGNHTHDVPTGSLRPGQIVRLRPGDRAPCDGRILSGTAFLDEAAVTGESLPVARAPGDAVIAGSICTDAVIDLEVTAGAGENTVARIARLVEEAERARAPTQRFIEAFARFYMPAIVGLAAVVAVAPPLAAGGGWGDWVYRALTLLLIGCPCALVISVPAAVASALATGTRAGLLFKGGAALEATARLTHVALDKTGTLTEGRFRVTGVHPAEGVSEEALLVKVAAVEAGSVHPLADAIRREAESRGLRLPAVTAARILPGVGAEGLVEGVPVQAVSLRAARAAVFPVTLLERADEAERAGASLVVVLVDGAVAGLLALADTPRAEAAAALAGLRRQGLDTVMLTGDSKGAAEAVAGPLGLAVRADLLPGDKLAALDALAAQGQVMMVGDGVNDAPALRRATVGVAMGSGTDAALDAADAAILRNDLRGVPAMIDLARRTRTIILQNVAVALGLKALFLIFAIGGGVSLWMAVLADSGATVLVTLNALRLQRWRAPA